MFGEGKRLPAAVVRQPGAGQQAAVYERREQLRDGRRGDRRAAGKLGTDDLSLGDRLQRQILGDRQRWIVRGEQTLDPAADEWRSAGERLRRLAAADVLTRPRN